ncbi:MAG TPA: hypothetical protein VMJ66_05950, partial [Geobacteraceae bacterium]|nr:hypothetical protein [Geobacteraceae bacterium]
MEFLINDDRFAENMVSHYDYTRIACRHLNEEISATADLLNDRSFDIIVVDFYDKYENRELLRLFTDKAKVAVMAISDDFRKVDIDCDYLLVTEPAQAGYGYDNEKQVVFQGERYGIVSREFIDNKTCLRNTVNNVLISFGGHDPHNTTCKIAGYLANMAHDHDLSAVTFNFLIGGIFAHEAELADILAGSGLSHRLHKALPSVAPLFAASDLALTACGNTLYELCHIGVPMIAVGLNERQHEAGRLLHNRRLIKYAGYHAEITEAVIRDLLTALIGSYTERLMLHDICKKHFDIDPLEEICKTLSR